MAELTINRYRTRKSSEDVDIGELQHNSVLTNFSQFELPSNDVEWANVKCKYTNRKLLDDFYVLSYLSPFMNLLLTFKMSHGQCKYINRK